MKNEPLFKIIAIAGLASVFLAFASAAHAAGKEITRTGTYTTSRGGSGTMSSVTTRSNGVVSTQGTWTNHDVRRTRKLLLHRKEIEKLSAKTAEQGLTLVPLELYFKDGKAKVELGLGRGKRTYDKRHDLASRDAAREVDRALRRRR